MKTSAEETKALLFMAGGGATVKVEPEIYAELYGKGLVAGGKPTEAGKAHLRAIAGAMTAAPGKRTYVVVASIVRRGRTMNVGDEFEACPVGTHVRRWLAEGRIEER